MRPENNIRNNQIWRANFETKNKNAWKIRNDEYNSPRNKFKFRRN